MPRRVACEKMTMPDSTPPAVSDQQELRTLVQQLPAAIRTRYNVLRGYVMNSSGSWVDIDSALTERMQVEDHLDRGEIFHDGVWVRLWDVLARQRAPAEAPRREETTEPAPAEAGVETGRTGADQAEFLYEKAGLRIEGRLCAPQVYVARVSGAVEQSRQAHLSEALDQLRGRGARWIGLRLECVGYMSSAGWGVLTGVLKELRGEGGDLGLLSLTTELQGSLRLLEFQKIFRVFGSESEFVRHSAFPRRGDAGRVRDAPPRRRTETENEKPEAAKSLEEAIARIIADYGPVSILAIKRHLGEYGPAGTGFVRLYRTLRAMNLDSKARRVRYYRSC